MLLLLGLSYVGLVLAMLDDNDHIGLAWVLLLLIFVCLVAGVGI